MSRTKLPVVWGVGTHSPSRAEVRGPEASSVAPEGLLDKGRKDMFPELIAGVGAYWVL